LRCRYCFHDEIGYDEKIMTIESFKRICELTIPYYDQITFIWHGGEPLCAGEVFFDRSFRIQDEMMKKYNSTVKNVIQTNATLINDKFIELFKKNNVKVGISYDGVKNEWLRGQTESVLNGIEGLKEVDINPGIISVVTGYNLSSIFETYELMKEKNLPVNFNHLSVTDLCDENNYLNMTVEEYSNAMIDLYNYWIDDELCNINVNPFTHYLKMILNNEHPVCKHASCLGRWLSIDSSGDISACNRYFPPEFCMGNVHELENIEDAYKSIGFRELLMGSVKRRELCKSECEVYNYCLGGCNNEAYHENGISSNNGFSCKVFKSLFTYIYNDVQSRKHESGFEAKNQKLSEFVKGLVN